MFISKEVTEQEADGPSKRAKVRNLQCIAASTNNLESQVTLPTPSLFSTSREKLKGVVTKENKPNLSF